MRTSLRFTVAAIGLASCSVAFAKSPEALKPEQIVESSTSPYNIACISPSTLEQYIAHAVAGERTKLLAMMPVPCTNFPAGQRYKILSVRRTMIEIIQASSSSSSGMWVAIEAFQPPSPNR
ncbi:hypothetical protein SAMN05518669_103393 [Variovorax sp. YR634]|uniref:hypothetical protein n=1 Tax=Variovorax sp. YR634 TaxID=1884385 RepID=UPI00089CB4CB|nr:hypothetical protein [Variovorax sp. YR634]SDX14430.1 hypothetical protein SAMN05518669_103393 [Variovorax sp. YR634]